MVDFDKSNKMIKISGKVNKLTLTTDSAILIFCCLFKKELHQNQNGFFLSSEIEEIKIKILRGKVGWLVGFYDISIFLSYLMLNQFL